MTGNLDAHIPTRWPVLESTVVLKIRTLRILALDSVLVRCGQSHQTDDQAVSVIARKAEWGPGWPPQVGDLIEVEYRPRVTLNRRP